jgi:hypothetical protein
VRSSVTSCDGYGDSFAVFATINVILRGLRVAYRRDLRARCEQQEHCENFQPQAAQAQHPAKLSSEIYLQRNVSHKVSTLKGREVMAF